MRQVFAQLEGKNIGIVMPDADLDVAAAACATGGLSYNGQRCTAVKPPSMFFESAVLRGAQLATSAFSDGDTCFWAALRPGGALEPHS